MLAKQQVPIDISREISGAFYTQVSNPTVRLVLIDNLTSKNQMAAVYYDTEKAIIQLSTIFDKNAKTELVWDALKQFGIKEYPLQILYNKTIPNQQNVTEEELKEARLR
jgi:hypothetical protein